MMTQRHFYNLLLSGTYRNYIGLIISVNPDTASNPSTTAKKDSYTVSRSLAAALARGAQRPGGFPVRKSFVQLLTPDDRDAAPLSRIVGRKGGGGVPLKLYLALLWQSTAAPFTTKIPARKWAELLALPEPSTLGARRVIVAFQLLEEMGLVKVRRARGDASEVEICDEAGGREGEDPRPYTLPYDALLSTRTRKRDRKQRGTDYANLYFKVPAALWTKKADIQRMSPAALSMLLAYLNEAKTRESDPEVWWSTNAFPERYRISPAMRSRGTRELVNMKLLRVKKRSVGRPGVKTSFTPERVRNVYAATRRLQTYMDQTL